MKEQVKAMLIQKIHPQYVEKNQLYLYKPSVTFDNDNYYCMQWEIDEDYEIPLNFEIKFNEYEFEDEYEDTEIEQVEDGPEQEE